MFANILINFQFIRPFNLNLQYLQSIINSLKIASLHFNIIIELFSLILPSS